MKLSSILVSLAFPTVDASSHQTYSYRVATEKLTPFTPLTVADPVAAESGTTIKRSASIQAPNQMDFILTQIFQFLPSNDLKSCSLVCQAWNNLAIRYLYQTVSLSTNPARQVFANTIQTRSYGNLVQNLMLGESKDSYDGHTVQRLVKKTTKLKSFAFCGYFKKGKSDIVFKQTHIPRIYLIRTRYKFFKSLLSKVSFDSLTIEQTYGANFLLELLLQNPNLALAKYFKLSIKLGEKYNPILKKLMAKFTGLQVLVLEEFELVSGDCVEIVDSLPNLVEVHFRTLDIDASGLQWGLNSRDASRLKKSRPGVKLYSRNHCGKVIQV